MCSIFAIYFKITIKTTPPLHIDYGQNLVEYEWRVRKSILKHNVISVGNCTKPIESYLGEYDWRVSYTASYKLQLISWGLWIDCNAYR